MPRPCLPCLPHVPCVCSARDAVAISLAENKPRRWQAPSEPRHPLLGELPTLRLMRSSTMGGSVTPRERWARGAGPGRSHAPCRGVAQAA